MIQNKISLILWRRAKDFQLVLEKINEILDIYRIIYNKGLNTSKALEYIEEEMPASDERDEIIGFIRESERGIIRRYSKTDADEEQQ